jgi:hypothetical protein
MLRMRVQHSVLLRLAAAGSTLVVVKSCKYCCCHTWCMMLLVNCVHVHYGWSLMEALQVTLPGQELNCWPVSKITRALGASTTCA